MTLLETELQHGRDWIRIGDTYGVTKKSRTLKLADCKDVPFVPMEAVPIGGEFEAKFDIKDGKDIKSGTYFERDDVLVGKITPSFENGKQALASNIPERFGYASTEIIPFHPLSKHQDPRLLFYYLLHPDIRSYLTDKMEGSTGRKRVPEDAILDLRMPEFAGHEQTAIANSLEAIQSAISFENRAYAECIELKQATMRELFTRGLRDEALKETEIGPIPESWSLVRIGSIARVGNGSTPKKSISAYWSDGTFPWLSSAKVYDREIRTETALVSQLALKECHLPILEPGTVLVAITGQGKTLGHVGVLSIKATINQHLAYISIENKSCTPAFLRGFLETQYSYFRQVASGGGSTKGALTCGFLKTVKVPTPPTREEQDEVVEVLEAIDAKIDLHKRKKAILEDLFKSLLHKLMTGEIRASDLDLSVLATNGEVTA